MPVGRVAMAAVEVVRETEEIVALRVRTLRQPPWVVNERARPRSRASTGRLASGFLEAWCVGMSAPQETIDTECHPAAESP